MKDLKSTQEGRKRHNEQLIRRMKAGEPLWSYDSKASWFPPRPMIEKDPEAIKRLYSNAQSSSPSQYQDAAVKHVESRLKVLERSQNSDKSDKTG